MGGMAFCASVSLSFTNTMFELNGVSKCIWHQDFVGHRSMSNLSSDLWMYVLDIWIKRKAELSTDQHLVVSWISWREDYVGQTP